MRTEIGRFCPLILASYAVVCHPELVSRKGQLASELPSNMRPTETERGEVRGHVTVDRTDTPVTSGTQS